MSRSAYYRHFSKYSDKTIQCPQCNIQLTLKEYENQHAFQCRQLRLKETCIFCTSGKRWTARNKDFKHMIPCLEKFVKEHSPREEDEDDEDEEDEGPMEWNETPIPCAKCKKFRSRPRQMFGRTKGGKSRYLYDAWFEKLEDYFKSDIQFSRESGLGSDIYGIIQKFLKRDMEWYHLMVVSENFDNFVNAMNEMKDQMFLLSFWCLCDGMTKNRRVHRHMIIAVEPGSPFKQLWTTRVRYDFGDGSKSKNCIRIKTAYHLIRTIQYVSQRKSSCDGTQIKDEVENNFRCSHFYINRPLHEHAIVCMSTMFEGGMECLLKEQHRNKDVVRWLKHIQRTWDAQRHLKYAVPIGKTEFKFITCVLPLASYFEPTDEETDLFLTWLGSKKMYLRIKPSLMNLSREEWYTHQASKGNTVWSIRDEYYMLGPKQQNMIKQIKVAVEEACEMEKNRSEKKCRNWEVKHAELGAKHAELGAKHAELGAKHAVLEVKHAELEVKHTELEAKHAVLEVKHTELEAKHAVLEVKYATSEAERIRLTVESEMKKEHESQMLRCQNLNIACVNQMIYESSGSKKE